MFRNKTSYSDIGKILFIFICLLYGWVPFEAGSYDASFKIHLIFMLLLMIYAFYSNSFKLSKYGMLFFIFFIFLSSILFFVSYGRAIYSFIPAIAFASIVVPAIYNNTQFKYQFTQALFVLIVISIIMVFFQVIVYFTTGDLLLLHEFVFPFSKARIATELQFNNLTRMGGMYIEPGTYSNYMFLLLTLYFFLKKEINNRIIFFTALSIILTYSLWGMIFSLYLLLLLFVINFLRGSLKRKIFLLLIVIIGTFYGIQKIENSSAFQFSVAKLERNGSQNSTGAKKIAYEKFSKNFDNLFFIGDGFAPNFRSEISSLQDAGLLLNLAIVFGIIPTVILFIFFIFFIFKLTNYTIVLISLPIFMSKIFYWDPAFWLLVTMVYYEYNNRYKKIEINGETK